jgi:tetratricopeptide (TPR) repeat protein
LPRPSLAVVGFRNLSQRPADQWLSTAIAEMLATELASDGQLRVLPLSTVARAERDLGVVEGTGFSPEDIESLRAALGCDHLVVGTFAVADRPSHDTRIDIRDYHGADEPIVASALASEDQIFSAIVDGGRELRRALGLKLSPPEATTGARSAFPTDLQATRLYAEGVARLRLLDAVAARGLLESAAAREPTNPLIQAALANAWTALGYDGRASDAAQKAFDASGGLNREDRLNVEGRLYETQRKWPKAIDVYRTLWGYFADNVEYGLRLAAAQTSSGRAEDALATVESMRRVAADPRIDLAEAQAAAALGDFPRQLTVLQRMIPGVERSQSRLLLAQARLAEGGSYFNQGQPGPAEKSLEAARRIFIEVGDKAGAASTLNSMAVVLGDQQDLARVRGLYEEALAMSEQIGDRRGMSSALNNLGIDFKDQRRFAEALDAHRRALALRREIGDRNWTAVSLSNIGVVMFEEDRLREAATYYRDSLAISREIGDKRNQARVLHNLAIVDRVLGNPAAARAGFEESLAIRAQIGDKRGLVMGRVELATALLEQAEISSARQALEQAQREAHEARLKPGEAQVLFHLGETAIKAGDLGEAHRLHEQALALYEEIGATRNLIESQVALAELALAEDRPADAEAQARRVVDALGADSVGSMRFVTALVIARARLARGDLDAAQTSLTELGALADKSERADIRTAAAMVGAEYDAARGHTARARQSLQSLRAWLGPAGLVLADLEARLLLWRIDRVDRRPNARDDAVALERDARARNAGMILRHLQSH